MQHVHQDRKCQQKANANQVNNRFQFTIERFFTDPFNRAEHHLDAVQRRDRQKIEHGTVHPNKRGYIQERR